MASERIEKLLEKYFAAETTVAEEKELTTFFNSAHVPDHLKEYRSLFVFFVAEKKPSVSSSFNEKVLNAIEPEKKNNIRWLILTVSAAAAVILIVLSLTFLMKQNGNGKEIVYDQPDQKQIAYNQTKDALMFVSSKINIGKKQMKKVGKFNEAKNRFINSNKN